MEMAVLSNAGDSIFDRGEPRNKTTAKPTQYSGISGNHRETAASDPFDKILTAYTGHPFTFTGLPRDSALLAIRHVGSQNIQNIDNR